jgi:signal transduction histidine kinase
MNQLLEKFYSLPGIKKIAERHRAKIKAQSDGKGQGALFEVEFPLN